MMLASSAVDFAIFRRARPPHAGGLRARTLWRQRIRPVTDSSSGIKPLRNTEIRPPNPKASPLCSGCIQYKARAPAFAASGSLAARISPLAGSNHTLVWGKRRLGSDGWRMRSEIGVPPTRPFPPSALRHHQSAPSRGRSPRRARQCAAYRAAASAPAQPVQDRRTQAPWPARERPAPHQCRTARPGPAASRPRQHSASRRRAARRHCAAERARPSPSAPPTATTVTGRTAAWPG